MFNPEYQITNQILKDIGRIEAAREVILDSPLLPLWERRFREDAVVRSVHHGTHIEGNKLNIMDAKDVLLGKEVIGRPRDIQEIINYRKVLEIIEKEAEKDRYKLTENLIKKAHRVIIHKILNEEESGQYRSKRVVIRNSQTGEITFRPPAPLEVPYLVREFVSWSNKAFEREIHYVIIAGIAHHELVRIHPFIDGNGRVARMIATLILFLGKYDIRRFFSLEEYYDRDAYSYYRSLQKASDGDLTSWLEYFIKGVSVEFERVKEKVLKLSKDTYLKNKLGGKQIFLTDRQVKLIEYIQSIGYLQNKNFESVLPDVSEDTVLRDLKELLQSGIIKKIGKTKSARYVMV